MILLVLLPRRKSADFRKTLYLMVFASYLIPKVFHPFETQVKMSLPSNKDEACWIAGKGFGFIEVDVTLSELSKDNEEYVDANIEIALDKIQDFVKRNFSIGITPQLIPTKQYFTHGSYINNPQEARPFRFWSGGHFKIRY